AAGARVAAATVGALVAVNAAGDVRDPATGRLLAGARDAPEGRSLVDARQAIRDGTVRLAFAPTHTTIGLVATDAPLTRPEAARLAALAQGGPAATPSPPHPPVDGDPPLALPT